ncbi:MAG: patatin-like phospholipase family protein [Myxococcota bacterium]
MTLRLIAALAGFLLLSGCAGMLKCVSSDAVLNAFNTPAERVEPRFTPCTAEVEGVLRETLADVYEAPGALDPLGPTQASADALADATACARTSLRQGTKDTACFDTLFSALPFPAIPPLAPPPSAAALDAERDVHRVQHNLQRAVRAVATACMVRQGTGFPDDSAQEKQALSAAWKAGVTALKAYQAARPRTVRGGKPVTAFVLAGGAANGAFSAGAVWWLLKSREACGAACAGYTVDMLAGASTGTVIAAITKRYFSPHSTPAEKAEMLNLLQSRYTCSTNAELYCTQKMSLYDVLMAKDAPKRGLVKFDGLRKLIDDKAGSLQVIQGAPEQFSSAVDFESARVYHLCSSEQTKLDEWHAALEASLVEPLLAQPVEQIGVHKGTWIDGGIRSGLPLSAVLRRGADRAVMFVNTAVEGIPRPPQDNAAAVGFRALDLFTLSPITGELVAAEHERVLRSVGEKERCLSRFGFDTVGASSGAVNPAVNIERFCSGLPLITTGPVPLMAPVTLPGTPQLERVRDGYRGAWLFMPQDVPEHFENVARLPDEAPAPVKWDELGAVGYQFNPREMWRLFALGALTAQQRCEEVARTLAWPGIVAECTNRVKVEQALGQLRSKWMADKCGEKPLEARACP